MYLKSADLERIKKMSRFDYVKYDEKANEDQAVFKNLVQLVEQEIANRCKPGRATSLALTKLEECYMWIGKQIRDDQIARNGSADLQEERTNS